MLCIIVLYCTYVIMRAIGRVLIASLHTLLFVLEGGLPLVQQASSFLIFGFGREFLVANLNL